MIEEYGASMEQRRLGLMGLNVGLVSPGTQYLTETTRENVVSVVREGVEFCPFGVYVTANLQDAKTLFENRMCLRGKS